MKAAVSSWEHNIKFVCVSLMLNVKDLRAFISGVAYKQQFSVFLELRYVHVSFIP